MKILVTGGAGFAGSNFVRHILNKYPDYQVVNLDKLTYAGNLSSLVDLENNPRYQFIQGDIVNPETVTQVVAQGVDLIVNYAAETHVDRSILNPAGFVYTDLIGTFNLLEAARKYKVARYIQISTDEVFGEVETGLFTEKTAFNPRSPYSASKAGADHLVMSYWHTYQLPIMITHSCNLYGPYQYPEKLIPLFITNLEQNKSVPVYGDGLQTREFLHVEDHCRAIDFLIHLGSDGQVYNIGSGEVKQNIEVTKELLKLLGKDQSFIKYVTDRPGHDRAYQVDFTKLKKLGFNNQISWEDGLKSTVEWYLENKLWWSTIRSQADFRDYYQQQYSDLKPSK